MTTLRQSREELIEVLGGYGGRLAIIRLGGDWAFTVGGVSRETLTEEMRASEAVHQMLWLLTVERMSDKEDRNEK